MTRRSRSFLMQEALKRHLDEIVAEAGETKPKARYSSLLAVAGAGAARKPRTAADVDAHIRWLREHD